MLSNKCSKPLVYDPWYSYNQIGNSQDGQMAGGSGGQSFSFQFLQHSVKSIQIIWDAFSIRQMSLKFTNGKEKSAGSKQPQHGQMFQNEIELEHGEQLNGQILIGEGYTQLMHEIEEDHVNECKQIGVSYLAFKTSLGREFNAGNENNITNLINIDVNDRILAGFLGSAGNSINRLSIILQKPIKLQYVSKIFWHNYEMLNFNNQDSNIKKLQNKQIQINEFNQECNFNNSAQEIKLSQNVQLGEDVQLSFDIPFINEKDSLLGFVSMFPKIKETVIDKAHQDDIQFQNSDELSDDKILKSSNQNNITHILKTTQQSHLIDTMDTTDDPFLNDFQDENRMSFDSVLSKESREDQMTPYEKLLSTQAQKQDHIALINPCSCARIQQRVINGLNDGLRFYIHYKMEFTDGTDFTSFQEGIQKAGAIVQPNHELIQYSIPDYECFMNM